MVSKDSISLFIFFVFSVILGSTYNNNSIPASISVPDHMRYNPMSDAEIRALYIIRKPQALLRKQWNSMNFSTPTIKKLSSVLMQIDEIAAEVKDLLSYNQGRVVKKFQPKSLNTRIVNKPIMCPSMNGAGRRMAQMRQTTSLHRWITPSYIIRC